jgi:hypothetical protein
MLIGDDRRSLAKVYYTLRAILRGRGSASALND